MPLDRESEEIIMKNVWLKFYPDHERHDLLRALEMFGAPQKLIANVLGVSNQSVNYFLTGQRPLPVKYTMKLIALLFSCITHAVHVLEVMDERSKAEMLPPRVRKASDKERAKLNAAICWARLLTGKYFGKVS